MPRPTIQVFDGHVVPVNPLSPSIDWDLVEKTLGVPIYREGLPARTRLLVIDDGLPYLLRSEREEVDRDCEVPNVRVSVVFEACSSRGRCSAVVDALCDQASASTHQAPPSVPGTGIPGTGPTVTGGGDSPAATASPAAGPVALPSDDEETVS